jgi:hypothetical protein
MTTAPPACGACRGLLFLLAALAWSVPRPSFAQASAPKRQAEVALPSVAHAVVNYLAQGCTPNLGSAERLESFARANNFAPARSEFQTLFQRFGPGAAWVQQRSDIDLAVVWTQDTLQCRVLARRADIETARTYFRSVIEGVRRPGVSITKETDREVEEGGRRFHQIGYRLQNDLNPQDVARAFILTTFPAPDAPFAAIATVAATQRR